MTTRIPEGLQKQSDDIYTEDELKEAFPDIDPGFSPLGSRIIVQIRSARNKSKGGIIFTNDVKDTEKWNTQIGKVRAIGDVAFRNRTTLEIWPEGQQINVGDFVRVPKFNQDRWEINNGDTDVLFMSVTDVDIIAKITCNPLSVKAFI